MKKIIVLFNGISAPWHITTFALNIAKQHNAAVLALFLKDDAADYPFPSDIKSVQKDYSKKQERADDESLEEKNIQMFKTFCQDENVMCDFRKNISLKELVKFSSDASIVVSDARDESQKYSLKEIMTQVKCPICLVSANASEIKTSILLYDGKENSMHAIKSYTEQLPKLCEEKSYLVRINEEDSSDDAKEAVQQFHNKFPALEEISLKGNLEKTLLEFLDEHTENAMVVMGAYGRSALSLLFKPSLSNVVLKQTRTSLFIAHD